MHISLDSALGRQRRLNSVGESVFQIAPDAAAGYSLRSLTGGDPSVVRVRRESDNGERDFNASGVSSGELVNWVNQQITPPLDLRELTATGRDGPIIEAAAAYSLRNLSDSYAGDVVEVRRNTDGALKDFKASEVTDGTLEAWVNTSFANALPLDTSGAAAAAYSLRNLSSSYTGSVVEVRRSSDGALRSFTAAEVANSTLLNWVNADVVTYTSDFSAGNDGWLNFSQGALTSNIDGIGGLDDNLRFTKGTGPAILYINNVFGLGSEYTISVDYYFPSSNTNTPTAVGFLFGGSNLIETVATPVEDTWNNWSVSGALSDSAQLQIRPANLATGDLFYIRNVVITQTTADGHVKTWYDQSGNDKHATQGTPASQPKIVSGGSLVTGGLDFDGGAKHLDFTPFSATNETIFVQSSTRLSNAFSTIISGADNRAVISQTTSSVSYNVTAGAFASISAASVAGKQLFTFNRDGTNVNCYQNGSLLGSNTTYANSSIQRSVIGRRGNTEGHYGGSISEVIIYNTDQSDKLRAIEENIGSNYGITLTSSKDGTVSKWYDQSTTSGTPNAKHAVQTNAAKQPKIVDGGSLVTGGLVFDGTSDFLQASIGTLTQPISGFSVFKNNSLLNSPVIWDSTSFTNRVISYAHASDDTFRINAGAPVPSASSSQVDGTTYLRSDLINTTASEGYVNGTLKISGNAGTNSMEGLTIGARYDGSLHFTNGSIAEIIIYNTDQSDNRTALEANIGEVYGIAGIPAYDNTVNGFVETWYDQSGNGNNATQLTAGSQPKIVDAGVLVSGGIEFDGVDNRLTCPSLYSSDISIFNVVTTSNTVNTDNYMRMMHLCDGSDSFQLARGGHAGGFLGKLISKNTAFQSGTTSFLHGDINGKNLISAVVSSTDTDAFVDGSLQSSSSLSIIGSGNSATTTIGARDDLLSSTFFAGSHAEIIIYNSDQSANRLAIEANINNQYDIY